MKKYLLSLVLVLGTLFFMSQVQANEEGGDEEAAPVAETEEPGPAAAVGGKWSSSVCDKFCNRVICGVEEFKTPCLANCPAEKVKNCTKATARKASANEKKALAKILDGGCNRVVCKNKTIQNLCVSIAQANGLEAKVKNCKKVGGK